MRKFLGGLFLAIGLIFEVKAQSFEAVVNRNPVPEGETVVLTLELKDVDTSASPDLSALSKDFTVMSVSNGYRTNIINGDVSKSRQWNLVMIPNKSGNIVIPEIELAGYKTKPITLQVGVLENKNSANGDMGNATDNSHFKIDGSIDNNNPYVQQQITYKLKLYDAGGLQGDAPVFMVKNDDWVIKSLGEPEVVSQIVNGQNVREITFNYALFAQKSGSLEIPAVRFNGYYLTKSKRVDPFAGFFKNDDILADFGLNDIFARKNPVILTAKPIAVEVKPAAITDGWWLPASKLNLSAGFEPTQPKFIMGEPVSRTIYVKAYGVTDKQLPELKFANVAGVKQYPEKPQVEMAVENGQVVSLAKISNVYIPSKSGEIELPEIKLNWFDVKNNTMETASIPAFSAVVAANADAVSVVEAEAPAAKVEQPEETNEVATASVSEVEKVDNSAIIFMLLGAFFGGMLLALILFKLFGRGKISAEQTHYRAVISAAENRDVHTLREELLKWGKNKFPDLGVVNLQDLAEIFCDENFNRQLDKIRETLYSGSKDQWDGAAFVKSFKEIASRKNKSKNIEKNNLPKLYK